MEGYNQPIGTEDQNQGNDPGFNWSQQAFFIEQERMRRKEKINSLLIIVVGVGALVFGFVGIFVSISNPFADIIKKGQEQARAQQEQEQAQLLALQTTDTDKDGIVDYLETNKYGTSPYLSDSDSDGFDDALEISRGTDPNCPEGKTCLNASLVASSTGAGNVPKMVTEISTDQGNVAITTDLLREVLIESGFDKDKLAEIPDSEIVAVFQEYARTNPEIASKYFGSGTDQEAQSSLPSPDASKIDLSSLGVKSLDDLKNLSGGQIRDLLVQSGAPADLLKTVSDEQLKELFINQLETKINSNSN